MALRHEEDPRALSHWPVLREDSTAGASPWNKCSLHDIWKHHRVSSFLLDHTDTVESEVSPTIHYQFFPCHFHKASPKHPLSSPVQSQNALPVNARKHPIPPGRSSPQSHRHSRIDVSWRMSHLDHRAEGLLGQPREMPIQGVPFLQVHNLGSHRPLCPWAPLGLYRWAPGGLRAHRMGLVAAGAGYYLGSTLAIVSQCSLMGVQTSFYHIS